MARKEKKYHFIYKTTNLLNNKFYIGMHSTDDLDDGYTGSGLKLRRAIRKYGLKNFNREILESYTNRNDLVKREETLINDDLLKHPMCMNLRPGGNGGFISDKQQLQYSKAGNLQQRRMWEENGEWAQRMRKNNSNTMRNLHMQGKITYDTFSGKKHKPETIEKMKKSHKGKQLGKLNSQYGKCWITNGKINKSIKKEELESYKLSGWRKGRII